MYTPCWKCTLALSKCPREANNGYSVGILYTLEVSRRHSKEVSLTSQLIRRDWHDHGVDGTIDFETFVKIVEQFETVKDPLTTFLYALNDDKRRLQALADPSSVSLSFLEFSDVMRLLHCNEKVQTFFELYCTWDGARSWMSREAVARFLTEVQNADEKELTETLQIFDKMTPPLKDPNFGISSVGFHTLIMNHRNDVFHPAKLELQTDTLTHPFSHYWIASSHNTYLPRAQILSKSTADQYITVLLSGCRCVEIDCWDGPDNQPFVFHGYAMTTKLTFQKCIQVCRDYGFKVSNGGCGLQSTLSTAHSHLFLYCVLNFRHDVIFAGIQAAIDFVAGNALLCEAKVGHRRDLAHRTKGLSG